jgi:ribosomal protein S18 acetylase RimI-like enzyme
MAPIEDTRSNPFALLEWDSDHFGFPIGRVHGASLSSDIASAALDWARSNSVRCLYFLADSKDSQTISSARESRFDLVDVRMTMRLDGLDTRTLTAIESLDIRRALQSDGPALEEIASNAHRDTRFFVDTRFPEERARELYRKWIRRDIADGRMLVANLSGERLGYISLSLPDAGNVGSIGLLGVAENARGRGIGGGLLKAVIELAKESCLESVDVVTQAANIPAQRLYQAAGFRSSFCQYWFHRWFS